MRAECLDWLLILGSRQLDMVLRVFVEHYNSERPHRALGRYPPAPPQSTLPPPRVRRSNEGIDPVASCTSTTGPRRDGTGFRHPSRTSLRSDLCTLRAALATRRHAELGLPPLPNVTPHSLRRTYISIALLANNFDVKWVMSQVGHADSKMTLDVYAQLEQRVQRDRGRSFDRLVLQAREQLDESKAA